MLMQVMQLCRLLGYFFFFFFLTDLVKISLNRNLSLVQEIIITILTPEAKGFQRGGKDDASKRNLVKLQSLFESCMDEKKLTDVGLQPMV